MAITLINFAVARFFRNQEGLCALRMSESIQSALAGVDAVIFAVGHSAYRQLDPDAVFAMVGVIKISLGTIVLAIVYFILGYLLFATLMAVAGSMGTSMRESQQIAGIFALPS